MLPEKVLILMTPKSLLRHKKAVSKIEEFGPDSTFHRVLWDDAEFNPASETKLAADDKIRRVARTIADLDGARDDVSDPLSTAHVAEAVGYRLLDRRV